MSALQEDTSGAPASSSLADVLGGGTGNMDEADLNSFYDPKEMLEK